MCIALGHSTSYDWTKSALYGSSLRYGAVSKASSAIVNLVAAAMLLGPGASAGFTTTLRLMDNVGPLPSLSCRPDFMDDMKAASPFLMHAYTDPWISSRSKTHNVDGDDARFHRAETVSAANYATVMAAGAPLSLQPRIKWEVSSRPDAPLWRKAEREEMNTINSNDVFELVTSPLLPGVKPLHTLWSYKYKIGTNGADDRFKARLVIDGSAQTPATYDETYAATLRFSSFRLLFALAAKEKLFLMSADVKGGFLHATLPQDVYAQASRGFYTPGTILRVKRSLYGLKQAPRLF